MPPPPPSPAMADPAAPGRKLDSQASSHDLAVAGDERAKRIFEIMGEMLGMALATLANTFNYPLYLLSGGILPAWDFFAPKCSKSRASARSPSALPIRGSKKPRWATKPDCMARRTCRGSRRTESMWMGIDTGTGGSRALLVDARGRVARGGDGGARRYAHGAAAVGRAAPRELVGRGGPGHPRRPGAGWRHRRRHSRASDSPARCTDWCCSTPAGR